MSETIAQRRSAFDGLHSIRADGKVTVTPGAHETRFSFRGSAEAAALCSSAFGVSLPTVLPKAETNGTRTAISLGPDEWQLIAEDGVAESLGAQIESALGSTFHSLVDISHRNTAFDVSGPAAEILLASGVLLDLNVASFPIGMATRTIYSKAEIILWRKDATTFNVSVWRSFVPFVWGLLHEASEEL